jgi:tol-pal system protein YbgF
MNRYLYPLLLLAVVPPLAVGASMEQRVARLERVLSNQSLSDIVLRLQQLQTEVQQLRGELEMQKHAMDALKRRQRNLYMDLDGRLGQGGTPAADYAAPPEPVAAPVETHEPLPAPAYSPDPAPAAPGPAVWPAAGDPAREQAEYQNAFDLLKKGSYTESIGAFRSFLDRYPAGDYADNAWYWLGEASYVKRDFTTALGDFNQLLQQYPASPKVPGALLKIGYIQYEQRNWSKARKILQRLEKEYPSSTEARLAAQRLERMRRERR